jgi:hypothetical protein
LLTLGLTTINAIRDTFDLVLGFGGGETLPDLVDSFIAALVKEIATGGVKKIWDVVTQVLADHQKVVEANTVVAIYREGSQIRKKEVGRHTETRPFGYMFSECGTHDCPGHNNPFNTRSSSKNGKVRLQCSVCTWKSGWVKVEDNEYFTAPRKHTTPLMFEHEFPAVDGLKGLFINAALEKPEEQGKRKRGGGTD